MADLVGIANGNLTSASTWGLVDSTSKLVSTSTGNSALGTGNSDSATFTPGAITVIGVAVRLASRAAGSPSNTITITLRNSTGGSDVASVTANVSDLPACSTGTNGEGGWHFFKFSSSQLLLAATNYLIRASLSSTSTAVSLCTNGTANNWQHLLVTSSTQAPAAGDDMYIAQLLDGSANPATPTAVTVTMDSNATTDYGSASTSTYTPALSISKGGTLICGTNASTNYVLRISGWLAVYSGGTLNFGTVATPIPRTSTAVLEFDCGADAAFGLIQLSGSTRTFIGQSRTSGKDISFTFLTANMAASTASATVADDTGWLSGDEVALAPTTRTRTNKDILTLASNAGASSLSFTGNSGFAHSGSTTDKDQAEVVLLTRNVQIRSTTSANATKITYIGTASVDDRWVLYRYCGVGNGGTNAGHDCQLTTGNLNIDHCVFRDSEGSSFSINASPSGGTWTITNLAGVDTAVTGATIAFFVFTSAINAGANITINNLIGIVNTATLWLNNTIAGSVTIGNVYASGGSSSGINFQGLASAATVTFNGTLVSHSNTGAGLGTWSGNARDFTFNAIRSWRNGAGGIGFGSNEILINTNFGEVLGFGNVNGTLVVGNNCFLVNCSAKKFFAYSDSSFTSSAGIYCGLSGTVSCLELYVHEADFGTSNGSLYTTHTTADIMNLSSSVPIFVNIVLGKAALATSTTISGLFGNNSYISIQKTSGAHYTYTPYGNIAIETTTVDVSPSMKLTPSSASYKLDTSAGVRRRGLLVPIDSGTTKTISVKVQKDGSYNGNAPRLIIKANPSVGINSDTVLDTFSIGSGSWETLSGTSATASADGVLECIVDCDGTAGNIFVDTWSVS